MDPLSQAVVGAVAGQNIANSKKIRIAGGLAFLSALLPDLDILIESSVDPLLYYEFHRHFTHALFFIPFGGLLAAALFYALFARKYLSFKQTALYCIAGYATHGLLDAYTSYGTLLLWPFSDLRVAWNCVSIIDPLFTLPLLLLISLAFIWRKPLFGRAALIYGLLYLSLGLVQHERALEAGRELALERGHVPIRLEAKPSFGNLVIWKIIYEHDNRYYVDAARIITGSSIIQGESLAKLNIERDFPWLDLSSQQAKDIQRFGRFSEGFLSLDKRDKNVIVDMRYSMLPNNADGLWGIRLSPTGEHKDHVSNFIMQTADRRASLNSLWKMIVERDVE